MHATSMRTHAAGRLSRADVGCEVRLGGWVHRLRDLGGIVFIDLRDREGLVQLSLDPAFTPRDVIARAQTCGAETVIGVSGTVAMRPNPARDESMVSRDVEVHVRELVVLGPAVTPAIPVARKEQEELAAEELRLKHRVLDLRRPELQANLVLRHRLAQRGRGLNAEQHAHQDITVPPAPVNAALTAALRMESWWLRAFDSPFGSSLLCLARKQD